MKVLALLSVLSLSRCEGFAPPAARHARPVLALSATSNNGNDPKHALPSLQHRAITVVAALALGWGAASGASFAVSDSDFADFSLPSYRAATDAAVNSNLKGDKFLLGEASKTYGQSSSSSSSASSGGGDKKAKAEDPKVAEKKAAENAKAEKAARYAEQKAARERQKAAVEALTNKE